MMGSHSSTPNTSAWIRIHVQRRTIEYGSILFAEGLLPVYHIRMYSPVNQGQSLIRFKLVKTIEMEQYTFEAILFLSILANYHKSDAARLNPYLKRIRESTDGEFMRKLCWASNYAL